MIEAVACGRNQTPFVTRDLNEARRYLSGNFRSHDMYFRTRDRRLSVRHSATACGAMSVHRLSYGGNVRLVAPQMEDFYLFQMSQKGRFPIRRGRNWMDVPEGAAYVVNPGEPFAKDWDQSNTQIILRVDRAALNRHAENTLCQDLPEVVFDDVILADAGRVLAALSAYLESVSDSPEWLRPQIEAASFSTLLATFPNNYLTHGESKDRDTSVYYVRRVEDLIASNPSAALTMQDFVDVSGVSARSLHYGFRQVHQTTPLTYLRNRRLELARQMLERLDPSTGSVAAIAFDCGFAHLPNFARHFCKRYGENPSAVLRRGTGSVNVSNRTAR